MNIFYTSSCPKTSALNLCIVHQNKMLVESLQILSTVHHVLDGDSCMENIYKPTHQNHPSTKWVMKSAQNYMWVWQHAKKLLDLYHNRSCKAHKSTEKLKWLYHTPRNINVSEGFTEPPAVVSDKVKVLRFFHSTQKKYQLELSLKYKEWQERSLTGGKRAVKVEFTNNIIPYFI